MNDSLRISQAGLNLIKEFEGCFTRAYYDAVHVLTIGYGHTNMDKVPPRVVPGMRITKEQALEILSRSLSVNYEPAVRRLVRVPLSQHEYDALVSFCYNCGEGNLARLVRKLNKGDYNSIPALLMRYNRAGGKVLRGLTRRRAAEAALWKSEPYQNHVEEQKKEQEQVRPKVDEVPDDVTPTLPDMTGKVETPDELPDKVAKWGGALSPFSLIMAYATDWRVLAVVCATVLIGGAAYMLWRQKTKQ